MKQIILILFILKNYLPTQGKLENWCIKNSFIYFFVVGCSYGAIKIHPTYSENETMLNRRYYDGYIELCILPLEWTPVCGGQQWTNLEASIVCNQLGYPNTTTIGT